jgi:hypothetical protein
VGDIIDFKPKESQMTADEFLEGFELMTTEFKDKLIEDSLKHHDLKMELLKMTLWERIFKWRW